MRDASGLFKVGERNILRRRLRLALQRTLRMPVFAAHLEMGCDVEGVTQSRIQLSELVDDDIQFLSMNKWLAKPGGLGSTVTIHLSCSTHNALYHTPLHSRLVLYVARRQPYEA